MVEQRALITTFALFIVLLAILIGFIALVLFRYQKKQHAFAIQLEDIKNKYEKELLKSKLEMQEETLEHISRELHDNIGQSITLAKLYINTIDLDIESPGAKKIEYAVDLLTHSLDDLRNISKGMSMELINADGLAKAIESQVNQLKKTERYDIELEIRGNYNFLEEQKEIILFRILQETINNIIRHAMADSVRIVLDSTPYAISLMVKDNGMGFNTENYVAEGTGFRRGGISNMMARAALIEAEFSIESKPGEGTVVRITVPFNNKPTYG
jgi:two-component system, NarL family, sensor kinase